MSPDLSSPVNVDRPGTLARRRARSGILACVFLLASCSTGSGDSVSPTITTTTSEPPTSTAAPSSSTTGKSPSGVPVPRWADHFCRDFQTWMEGITSQSESLSTGVAPDDIGALRTAIVDLFDALARQTEVLVDQIEETGPPDITDGDRFIADLIGKFESFGQVVEGARQKAETADITDPAAFRNTITSLVAEFQSETEAVTRTFSELDARYNSPELNAALDDECSFLHGSLPT